MLCRKLINQYKVLVKGLEGSYLGLDGFIHNII